MTAEFNIEKLVEWAKTAPYSDIEKIAEAGNYSPDCECSIDVDDVIEFIEDADTSDFARIWNKVEEYTEHYTEIDPPETLYDVQKQEIVAEALKKYSLEELERRLK